VQELTLFCRSAHSGSGELGGGLGAFSRHVPSDDDGQGSRSRNAILRDFEEDIGNSGFGLELPADLLCQKSERRDVLCSPSALRGWFTMTDEQRGLRITTWNGRRA
jgi:hypothetical protein